MKSNKFVNILLDKVRIPLNQKEKESLEQSIQHSKLSAQKNGQEASTGDPRSKLYKYNGLVACTRSNPCTRNVW